MDLTKKEKTGPDCGTKKQGRAVEVQETQQGAAPAVAAKVPVAQSDEKQKDLVTRESVIKVLPTEQVSSNGAGKISQASQLSEKQLRKLEWEKKLDEQKENEDAANNKEVSKTDLENKREQQEAQRLAKGGNLLPINQWQQRYPGGAGQGLRQPGPQIIHQQGRQMVEQAPMHTNLGGVRPGAVDLASANFARQFQALQQLMQTLKSQQEQQMLTILRANPPIVAPFIKQRQQAEMQQASGTAVVSTPFQQLQHILRQQQQPNVPGQQQRLQPNQMEGGGMLDQNPGGQPPLSQCSSPVGQQPLTQQQQQPFQQPNAPPSYQQRLPALRQTPLGNNSTDPLPDQQQDPPMQGLKPTPPPVPAPQGVMGQPPGGISMATTPIAGSSTATKRQASDIQRNSTSKRAKPSTSPARLDEHNTGGGEDTNFETDILNLSPQFGKPGQQH